MKVLFLDYKQDVPDYFCYDTPLDVFYGFCQKRNIAATYHRLLINPGHIEETLTYYVQNSLPEDLSHVVFSNPWQSDFLVSFFQKQGIQCGTPFPHRGAVQLKGKYDVRAIADFLNIDSPTEYDTHTILHQEWVTPMPESIQTPFSTRTIPEVKSLLTGIHSCLFTADPTENSEYQDISLPAEAASNLGCTFCRVRPKHPPKNIDFDRFASEAVLQIKHTKKLRPDLCTFLSEDQLFPHYAGRILEQLEREGLSHVELYFQSRVDTMLGTIPLLRKTLAKSHGETLSLVCYLIGFENFSEPELQRFNKNVTVEQNIRCVHELLELEQDFPGQFKVSTGTHGFLLYTPWTTLEDIEKNIQTLTMWDFEKLVSNFSIRKLRLTPDLPMYWKAKSEKLLEEGRDIYNYAQTTGYHEDIPWKFKDPIMEEYYRMVSYLYHYVSKNHLENMKRAYDIVTAPKHLCHLDRQRPCAFSEECRSISMITATQYKNYKKSLHSVDRERLELQLGQRSIIKREQCTPDKSKLVAQEFPEGEFYKKAIGSYSSEINEHGVYNQGTDRVTYIIAKNEDSFHEGISREEAFISGEYREQMSPIGALLGYPECCRTTFAKTHELYKVEEFNNSSRLLHSIENTTDYHCPLQHEPHNLVSYFPCSEHCESTHHKLSSLIPPLLEKSSLSQTHLLNTVSTITFFFSYHQWIRFSGKIYGRTLLLHFVDQQGCDDLEVLLQKVQSARFHNHGFSFAHEETMLFSIPLQSCQVLLPGYPRPELLYEQSLPVFYNKYRRKQPLQAPRTQGAVLQSPLSLDLSLPEQLLEYCELKHTWKEHDRIGFEFSLTGEQNPFVMYIHTIEPEAFYKKVGPFWVSYQGQNLSPVGEVLLKIVPATCSEKDLHGILYG